MKKIDKLLNEIAFEINEINYLELDKTHHFPQITKLKKLINDYLDFDTINDLDNYYFTTLLKDEIYIKYTRSGTKWEVKLNQKSIFIL